MSIAKNPNSRRTDADRRAQNKWGAVNRVTLAAKVDTTTGEAFRAWCAARGITVNAALTAYVMSCLHDAVSPSSAPASTSPADPADASGNA